MRDTGVEFCDRRWSQRADRTYEGEGGKQEKEKRDEDASPAQAIVGNASIHSIASSRDSSINKSPAAVDDLYPVDESFIRMFSRAWNLSEHTHGNEISQ